MIQNILLPRTVFIVFVSHGPVLKWSLTDMAEAGSNTFSKQNKTKQRLGQPRDEEWPLRRSVHIFSSLFGIRWKSQKSLLCSLW